MAYLWKIILSNFQNLNLADSLSARFKADSLSFDRIEPLNRKKISEHNFLQTNSI